MDFVLDFGNARLKWFNPRTNIYGDCRHAIVQLNESEWNRALGRGTPPEGFIRVNGTPYVVGDAARRYIIPERPKGAARYRQEYYGIGLCYALAEGLDKSAKNLLLFASHAPDDIKYARNLVAAAKGKWQVESQAGQFEFGITDVMTFDEPLGGYTHFTFTEKGTEKRNNPLEDATTLVIDVGGYTVDVAAVDPGGSIDPLSLRSTRTGLLKMTEEFEQALRANNSTLFQDTGDIDIRKIEGAILTGEFKYGKTVVDCRREANEALNGLTNDVTQVINSVGGVANFDYMLVTGGGTAMIFDRLTEALPRANFLMAESDRRLMKFANAFGGAKIAALMRNLGEI